MSAEQDLIQRWDCFLQKISDRVMESFNYAKEACLAQLVATDYEYETVQRSWMGMKAQIQELINKIESTWQHQVRPEMMAAGNFYNEEGNKASAMSEHLWETLSEFERNLEGELSQLFYDHAVQIANKKANCSQCNASIKLRKDIFRSQYITCSYCNAVNTIAPETKFLKIGWGIVDNIAKIKVQQQYNAMNEALAAIQQYRGQAPADFWEKYEKAYYLHWEAFFKERTLLNSEAAERLEKDMERKRVEFEAYKRIQTS